MPLLSVLNLLKGDSSLERRGVARKFVGRLLSKSNCATNQQLVTACIVFRQHVLHHWSCLLDLCRTQQIPRSIPGMGDPKETLFLGNSWQTLDPGEDFRPSLVTSVLGSAWFGSKLSFCRCGQLA